MVRRRLTSGLAVTLVLSAASAGAETFDLHLYRYCQPGTFCGHASEQAYQQYICQAVEEMNLVWEPAGISFRPTVVRWNNAGQVTVEVSGSGASLTPAGHPLPLLWQLNLDPDRTFTDQCGETDYSAASCTFRRRGAVLACR